MPESVAPVLIWACVVAFILCLAGALLVLFELWTPKRRATRNWLVSGVLVSAVGAVGSFATAQFSVSRATPVEANQAEAVRPPAGAGETPIVAVTPPPADEPAAPSPAPAFPEWAGMLGPRPGFEAATGAAYPACVARLRQRGEAMIPSEDALACRRELVQFHTDWILPVYNRKAPYERNLELQEQALRPRNLEPDILPRYSYIVSEMARLQGEQWDAFVALDRRVGDDTTSCLRRRCRSAA